MADNSKENGSGWNTIANLFGFRLADKKPSASTTLPTLPIHGQNPTFTPPINDDGAVVLSGNGWRGVHIDLDGQPRNEVELITRYREMAMQAEVESAVNDLCNEAIVRDDSGKCVDIVMDNLDIPEFIKDRIKEEFDNIIRLFNFGNYAPDLFRRWYVDGRLYFHIIIDKEHPEKGVAELRYIDPRKIRKVREVTKSFDPSTSLEIIVDIKEYYMYSERGILGVPTNLGVKISSDSIIYIPSGLLDPKSNQVVSYLQKAIKPLNQLRMVEDAVVIYRIARAPERRVFYIDVGNMPTVKANQYVASIMGQYKNKLVYDANSGEIKDDRRVMSMLEDYWLPRREGCLILATIIKLLDGRDVQLSDLIDEFKSGKQNWTYSVSPEGKIVPGKITWAGITRRNTSVMRIQLDNGEIITVTPDHKFILRNGEKIEAQNLEIGSSLMPIYTRKKHVTHNKNGEYLQVLDNETGQWDFVHRLVAENIKGPGAKNEVVHHIDFTRHNNNPENLEYMDKVAHFKMHSTMGTNSWLNGDVETHKKNLSIAGHKFFETEAGQKRKQEIAENNRVNPIILEARANSRKRIQAHRETDKLILSKEEYLAKWSKGLPQMQEFNNGWKAVKGTMSYKDYVAQYHHNHKVVSVTFLAETMDVGTLTVDGDNEYHDYHNFALSAGVFVMNSKGTEISTLPGGENLGAIEDIEYFLRKLYKALDVPISRLEPTEGFAFGRQAEINRDELKFMKHIDRLRLKFSKLIDDALKTQLILKGVLSEEDWDEFHEHIYYDFLKDTNITELKEQELWRSRFEMVTIADPFLGKYISAEWIRKKILMMTEEDIAEMEEQIEDESSNPRFINPLLNGGLGGGPMGLGGPDDMNAPFGGGGMPQPGGMPQQGMPQPGGMPQQGMPQPGGMPQQGMPQPAEMQSNMSGQADNGASGNKFRGDLIPAKEKKKRIPKKGIKKKLPHTTK